LPTDLATAILSARRSKPDYCRQQVTLTGWVIRGEIERMRFQVHRQRRDIRKLQQAGITTASAEALLERMLDRIDKLCAERDRLKKEHGPVKGKGLGGRSW
jgi:hypothetical protein